MINIAIFDDDQIFLEYFMEVVQSNFMMLGAKCQIACFIEPESFMEYISIQPIDLLFLDIEMPKTNGLEIAKLLRKRAKECLIVFVSNYEGYVFQSFDVMPFYYLRKQKIEEEIEGLIKRIFNKYSMNEIKLQIKEDCLSKDIPLNQIMYFKCIRNNTEVYTTNHMYLIKESITNLELKYDAIGFVRVDRGCLVNAIYVERLHKDKVILVNHKQIDVSRRRYKQVRIKLQQFVREIFEEFDFELT